MRSNLPLNPLKPVRLHKACPARHAQGLGIALRHRQGRRRQVAGNSGGPRQFGKQGHRNGPGARAKVQNAQWPLALRQPERRPNQRFRIGAGVQNIRRHPEAPAIKFAGSQNAGNRLKFAAAFDEQLRTAPRYPAAHSIPVPPRYLHAASLKPPETEDAHQGLPFQCRLRQGVRPLASTARAASQTSEVSVARSSA